MNITDPIRRHARVSPHARAVVRSGGSVVSYRDLDRTVDVVARHVLDLGLRPGQVVVVATAITAPYPFIVLALALARIGVATAPMSLPPEHVDACFSDGSTPVHPGVRKIRVDAAWFDAPPAATDVPPVPAHGDGAAIVRIFGSSGTTGYPKHMAMSHDLARRQLMFRWLALPVPGNVRQICNIGLASSFGFRTFLRALWVGGLVVLARNPAETLTRIDPYRVNHLVASPKALQSLLALRPDNAGPLATLESIEVGGSIMPSRLLAMVRERLCANVESTYGSSEAGIVAAAPMTAMEGQPGAVGFVVPGVEVEAVDEDDEPLPPGTEGILRVRSELCVDAYVGDPVTSARVFRGGWFYPGDVGSVSADGLLTIAGRSEEFINSGGSKVSPHLIEEVLQSSPQVREVAAFGVPGPTGIAEIWAAVVSTGTVDVDAIDALCRPRLRATTPKYILQLAELPRNESGKILRNELVEMALATKGQRLPRA